MAGKPGQLSDLHWKALALFEEGNLIREEVAAACGWKIDYLNHLCTGDTSTNGEVAALFKTEYLKIQKKQEEETKQLVANNTKSLQKLITRVIDEINSKKKVTPEDKKIISMYTNAVAKCQPHVSVGSVSFSYVKGMTPEELIHEFKKLKSVAESSFERQKIDRTKEL